MKYTSPFSSSPNDITGMLRIGDRPVLGHALLFSSYFSAQIRDDT